MSSSISCFDRLFLLVYVKPSIMAPRTPPARATQLALESPWSRRSRQTKAVGASTSFQHVPLSSPLRRCAPNLDSERQCTGCKAFLQYNLFLAIRPKHAQDLTEKCFKCRRLDAIADFLKSNARGKDRRLSIEQQADHIRVQRQQMQSWRATMKYRGTIITKEYEEEGMQHRCEAHWKPLLYRSAHLQHQYMLIRGISHEASLRTSLS